MNEDIYSSDPSGDPRTRMPSEVHVAELGAMDWGSVDVKCGV